MTIQDALQGALGFLVFGLTIGFVVGMLYGGARSQAEFNRAVEKAKSVEG